ncbi:MAG: nucleotide pyrophosphohydrolase [Candidatus Lokiarchaeota archaeon]|nr:nucleotide pyrophosphohydrolase [Candidatus Harpocratesius repetitus]
MSAESPNDENFTIQQFRTILKQFVADRDWEKYHTPRALSEAISIEAGELLENFLFKPDDYFHGDLTPITDEIADVFIYLLNLVNSLKLPNFTEIVLRKIEKNSKKYPIEQFSGDNYSKQ